MFIVFTFKYKKNGDDKLKMFPKNLIVHLRKKMIILSVKVVEAVNSGGFNCYTEASEYKLISEDV